MDLNVLFYYIQGNPVGTIGFFLLEDKINLEWSIVSKSLDVFNLIQCISMVKL